MSQSTPTTQVARPWATTLRTFLQSLVGAALVLGIVVPLVVDIILDEAGSSIPDQIRGWMLGLSAAVAAVAAILTRIMAIPQVEAWLQRHASRIAAGSAPYNPRHDA